MLRDFWKNQKKSDGNDLTSRVLISPQKKARAEIVAKESGIFCGKKELEFFSKEENLDIQSAKEDGEFFEKGEILLKMTGNARKILKSERIFLNFLGRMIGIATLVAKTRKNLPPSVALLPTRKTLWGALEKRAVVVGGGRSHRINLETAILAKENHLFLCGGISNALQKITHFLQKNPPKNHFFWEMEVETETEFFEVLKNFPTNTTGVVMLDNFSPERIRDLLQKTKKPSSLFLEASGGITPENIWAFADSGVDAISCGFLTHSVKSADISLRITGEFGEKVNT